ncbi:MAG: GDSL-type esterase/lipase family protein, partial [Eubacteriales bacterium]
MTIKKRKFVIILIVFVAFILSGCAALQGQTGFDAKIVVCVGDSITSGVGVTDASVSSYPAQLSKKMGGGYQVLNYGVAGSTVLEGGGAYKETRQYSLALRSGASAVVIALGTNDCRAGSWDAE